MECVLDVDSAGREPQKQAAKNYHHDQPRNPELFRFEPIPLSFELVEPGRCAPVLYSSAVRDAGQKLSFFRDHVLPCMLDACLNELPVESLLTQGLRTLIDHDRQKNSEYLHTLDLYLQNETSVSRTAEALFIHRSSLLKRLDKICRLLGSTLDSPEERLYLRLCLEHLQRTNREAL